MQEVTVVNLPPTWVMWLGPIGLLLFGLAMVAIAFKVMALVGQIQQTVKDLVEQDVRRDLMPDVKAITKNVKTISDDAASATHNVTGTVNRVSSVVTTVTNKLESPAIKAVGTISGIVAGARAFSGKKKPEVVVMPKKRGGLLGVLKK